MAIVDLGGTNLSNEYQGVLDNYLECGQDIAISFRTSASGTRGSTKWRKLDRPVWCGRIAAAPTHFQRHMPHNSLCILLHLSEGPQLPIDDADMGTYKKYDKGLQAHTVYIRLEDTSKAARHNFNGTARLSPPAPGDINDDWVKDSDSEADLRVLLAATAAAWS